MTLNAVGDQFLVAGTNGPFNISSLVESDVASDDNGNYIIVWVGQTQQSGGADIFAQRYRADGTPVGNQFRVNTTTTGSQIRPSVAMDSDGDFVVTWTSPNRESIQGRRFRANGQPIGNDFQVNADNTNFLDYNDSDIAIADNGEFVVTWDVRTDRADVSNVDIFARRFSLNNLALAPEFQVNTETDGRQDNPAIAIADNGAFVVTWESGAAGQPGGIDGDGVGIAARLFNAGDVGLSDDFQVNVTSTGEQNFPSVAMTSDGNFAVSWKDARGIIDNLGNRDIRISARQFGSTSNSGGNEILVAGTGTDGGIPPHDSRIAIDDQRNIVVAWQTDLGRSTEIDARRFRANGTPDGGITRVNGFASRSDNLSGLISDADGDIVATWINNSGSVLARQFSPRSSNPGNPGNPGNPPGNGGQRGTNGADRFRGTNGRDVFRALGGDDRLIGRGGNDNLVGGAGDDFLNGGGGRDRLNGGRGNDRLLGKSGNDRLNGGSGNDTLDAGSGNNVMKGGGGVDVFVLQKGKGLSRIKDFSRQDQISVRGRIDFDDLAIEEKRNGILVRSGNDELALFEGITLRQIEDFLNSIPKPLPIPLF